jgi:hypothetical protein
MRSTRSSAADVAAMTTIQIIERRRVSVAVVADDEAIVSAHLTGADRTGVQAMGLHAIENASGTRSVAARRIPTQAPGATPTPSRRSVAVPGQLIPLRAILRNRAAVVSDGDHRAGPRPAARGTRLG